MEPDTVSTSCATCDTVLDEPSNLPVDERQPCPRCGSLSRSHRVELKDSVGFHESLRYIAKRPGFRSSGKSRPFVEGFSGDHLSDDGTWAKVIRVIDRLAKRYREHVTLADGTVTRDIDEPLSDHFGRGSAKKQ
jgi:hypothetical protein